MHLTARDLSTATGRFLSVDPVRPGAPGVAGWNPYTYSANNPVTWSDPSGALVPPSKTKTGIAGGPAGEYIGLRGVDRGPGHPRHQGRGLVGPAALRPGHVPRGSGSAGQLGRLRHGACS